MCDKASKRSNGAASPTAPIVKDPGNRNQDNFQQKVVDAMGIIYGIPEEVALMCIVEQRNVFLHRFEAGRTPAEVAEDLRPEEYPEYASAVLSYLTSQLSFTNEEGSAFISINQALVQEHFERHVPPEDWVDEHAENRAGQIQGHALALKKQNPQDDGAIVLNPSEAMGKYLDQFVATGLYGTDRNAVVQTLLLRGIEIALPFASVRPGRK